MNIFERQVDFYEDNLFDDELLTRQSVNVYDPEFQRKLWGWSLTLRGKRRLP